MENKPCFYPYSHSEAKRERELPLWRESHKANIGCARDIQSAIAQEGGGAVQPLEEKWGLKRVNFVLANTLIQRKDEVGFSGANQDWARSIFVPPDKAHNPEFAVKGGPAALDALVDQARAAYAALGLFDHNHCEPDSGKLDYTGRVLVMGAHELDESHWDPKDQLWLAHDGFGCRPGAIGRSIRATCLSDGETTRLNRTDFTGVLRSECLPEWASEKLAELRGQSEQETCPSLGGMNMT